MNYLKIFINSILSGIMISIGGTVYVAYDNKIAGAFMFTVGLMAICIYSMSLFTGKIGYILQKKPVYLLDCLVTWIGNLCGTLLCGLIISYSKVSVAEGAKLLVDNKLQQSPLATIILGLFCGILMYIAVDNFKVNKYDFAKYLGLFVCVPAFIFAGFEHSIADMFYFSVATSCPMLSLQGLAYIGLVSLGNIIGALIIPNLKILADKIKD